MDTGNVVAFVIASVSATAAIFSVVFAKHVWRVAKKTMLHHVLADIQKDYRSPEMHHAVKRLWQLYNDHGKEKTAEEYEKIRQKEERLISSLSEEQKRIETEQSTLHYQRRLVSHFYQHLAALYVNKILPKDVVFKIWAEADLRIIPEILIPIENKLRAVLQPQPLPPLDESHSLLVLYRESKRGEASLIKTHSPSLIKGGG